MAIIREFNLHTNAGPSIPPVIHVNQYDRGETWKFKLYQPNGQQLTPTDAAIVGIKSDGHIIANAGTVSGGVISITETEQMTAAPGKAVFEILFDNDTHGTANFIVLVEPSPTNDGIASESDLSLFQEAIDSISPATINAAVSAWMSAHLTPSEWVIDNSLTVANAAADAKAAGDLIRQNTADIGDLTELVTEDQSSLVGAINETRTDLYNWFTDDIEKVKYIYEGSGSDADIYEVQRLEWDAANDADITGLKVITRKEGTSTDTSKFFVDGNELMEYVIGDTSDLSGTITEEISDLKSAIQQSSGLTNDIKAALMALANAVAFKGDDPTGRTYIDALEDALYPPVDLASISCVYTQTKVVYVGDSLDSLKSDLVVTAHYTDSTTAVVTDYVLSGSLTKGTSTITVTYGGKTATFTVTVSELGDFTMHITVANETLTNGYINDQGTITASASDYFIDKFYPVMYYAAALSNAILSGQTTSTKRVAVYDANKSFISRNYTANELWVNSNASAAFMKVGFKDVDGNHMPTDLYLIKATDGSEFTISGKEIDSDGSLTDNNLRVATDFISIQSGADKYVLCNDHAGTRKIAFYTSSQTFISLDSVAGTGKVICGDIPNNAAYYRVSKASGDTRNTDPIAVGI